MRYSLLIVRISRARYILLSGLTTKTQNSYCMTNHPSSNLVRSRQRLSRDLSLLYSHHIHTHSPKITASSPFTVPLFVRQVLQDHSDQYLVTFTCDLPISLPNRLHLILRSTTSKTVCAESRLLSTAKVVIPFAYPDKPISVLSWGSPTLDDGVFRPASSQLIVKPQPPVAVATLPSVAVASIAARVGVVPSPSKDMRQLLKYAAVAETARSDWLAEWGSLRIKNKAEGATLSQEQRQRRGVRGLFPLVYP
jgi:hypothetical protein